MLPPPKKKLRERERERVGGGRIQINIETRKVKKNVYLNRTVLLVCGLRFLWQNGHSTGYKESIQPFTADLVDSALKLFTGQNQHNFSHA